MNNADIIATVRQLRKLVSTLDAIGFPAKSLYIDEELSRLIPKGLPAKIVEVTFDVHTMLQEIEKSTKYREATKQLCNIKERP